MTVRPPLRRLFGGETMSDDLRASPNRDSYDAKKCFSSAVKPTRDVSRLLPSSAVQRIDGHRSLVR